MASLKYTLDQARDREVDLLGVKNIPNPWWPLSYGNDCLAFQLERLGVRKPSELDPHYISISAFRGHFGWDEIDADQIRPGDLAVENWSGTQDPEHIEYVYSVDHDPTTKRILNVTTISANTGPVPGQAVPRGVWKKTRPAGAWLLFGIRPPYKPTVTALTSKRRTEVRLIAAFLNQSKGPGAPRTAAEDDGIPGPIYWMLIQAWGHAHGVYGDSFRIDGVPGPQTRKVEATILAKAKER